MIVLYLRDLPEMSLSGKSTLQTDFAFGFIMVVPFPNEHKNFPK